jgi:DNA-binding GntR family transcriptional regulator
VRPNAEEALVTDKISLRTLNADAYVPPLGQEPPLRERIRQQLEELIVDGVYPPGVHLVEAELAATLRVSRGPIREALNQLHLQGWVHLEPRRGAFVHQPTAREADEYFGVRSLLESEAARLAAGHTQPEDVDAMRVVVQQARLSLKDGDERALYEASAAFHGHIYRLAANRVLTGFVEELDKRIRWYFRPVMRQRAPHAWDEHSEIVDALADGDEKQALELMRAHSERTRRAYLAMSRGTPDGSNADTGPTGSSTGHTGPVEKPEGRVSSSGD